MRSLSSGSQRFGIRCPGGRSGEIEVCGVRHLTARHYDIAGTLQTGHPNLDERANAPQHVQIAKLSLHFNDVYFSISTVGCCI